MDSIPLAELIVLKHTRIYDFVETSAIALMGYDYLILISSEVELIWRKKWNFVTLLFLITRYSMFADILFAILARRYIPNPSDALCKRLDNAILFINIIGVILAEGVLVLRTYAIWNSSKRIAWGFGGVLFAILVGVVAFVSVATANQRFAPSPSPSAFPGCFLVEANRQVWIGMLLAMLFETAIVCTTFYKVLQQWRYKEVSSTLVQTIYRDGISFFLLLFVVSLINIIVVRSAPDALAFMLTPLHRVLHASLTERIILNIRRAATRNKFNLGSMGGGLSGTTNPASGAMPEFVVKGPQGRRVKTEESMELSDFTEETFFEN